MPSGCPGGQTKLDQCLDSRIGGRADPIGHFVQRLISDAGYGSVGVAQLCLQPLQHVGSLRIQGVEGSPQD